MRSECPPRPRKDKQEPQAQPLRRAPGLRRPCKRIKHLASRRCIQQADVFNKEVYLEVYSKSMIQHSGLETQSLRLTASRAMAGDVRASLPSTLS